MNEQDLFDALVAPGCLLGWPEAPNDLMQRLSSFVETESDCCHKKAYITPEQQTLQTTRRMPVICYHCACDAKDNIVMYAGGILGAAFHDHPITGDDRGTPIDLRALGGATDG